jgi:5-carboxymethyl-2-hydroxymuconate isomerase
MTTLCRQLAGAMLTVKDEAGPSRFFRQAARACWPTPRRTTPWPMAARQVGREAGGTGDYAFVYLNVRMGRGRSEATQQRAGQTLLDVAKAFFAPVMAQRHIGITLQIDVGPEVFDAKHSNHASAVSESPTMKMSLCVGASLRNAGQPFKQTRVSLTRNQCLTAISSVTRKRHSCPCSPKTH